MTLTHRAQVKRFTQEVVKILKSQTERKCYSYQLADLYTQTFNVRNTTVINDYTVERI